MGWLFSNLRTVVIAAGVCMIISAVSGLIGYIKGSDSCELTQVKTDLQQVKKRDEIESKIITLPDADLNHRLNPKWMRGE